MKKTLLQTAIFLIFCGLIPPSVLGQGKIISGPMLGYIEHREALIWLEVSAESESVTIKYRKKGQPNTEREAHNYQSFGSDYVTMKVALEGLDMNTDYEYDIYINELKQTPSVPTAFRTKKLWEWREPAPNFSFLLGSCFYINDPTYDRPGKPYGQNPDILETMGNMPSDFMLWMGDNVYLREPDYSSPSGMAYRYSYNFRLPQMQKLRASRANYAIWDDHDYGPNDSDGRFELKEQSLDLFKAYWGNKTFGEPDNAGVYHKFKWSDCDFFCMDDRYYRSANNLPDSVGGKANAWKRFYGAKQLDWLKNSLISSQSTFKFIVTGGQMLNPVADKECFVFYPSEWQELMSFITDNKINGVIFLTGDRHYSELNRRQLPNAYPFYDFTCSSVTSGLAKPDNPNPTRVAGSLLVENNFGKISVSGDKNNRQVTFETYDRTGKSRWNFVVNEKELKSK
jgi:alkaline phosphatase D